MFDLHIPRQVIQSITGGLRRTLTTKHELNHVRVS